MTKSQAFQQMLNSIDGQFNCDMHLLLVLLLPARDGIVFSRDRVEDTRGRRRNPKKTVGFREGQKGCDAITSAGRTH